MNNSGTYSDLNKNMYFNKGLNQYKNQNTDVKADANPAVETSGTHKNEDMYLKQSVETATPAKLVEMLYTGAIKFLEQAEAGMDSKEYDKVNEKIKRVEDIIMELNISLDMEKGGAISTNLRALYNYMFQRLLEANAKKDKTFIGEVKTLLAELRDAWTEAMKKEGALANKLPDPKRARLNVSL